MVIFHGELLNSQRVITHKAIRVETPGETPKKWEFTSKTGGFTRKSLAKSEDFNHKSLEKYGEIL
jgi:hypothetical protein